MPDEHEATVNPAGSPKLSGNFDQTALRSEGDENKTPFQRFEELAKRIVTTTKPASKD